MVDVPGVHPGEHGQKQSDLESENREANGPHAVMPKPGARTGRRVLDLRAGCSAGAGYHRRTIWLPTRGALRGHGHAKSSPWALGYPAQAWKGLRFLTGSKLKRCRAVGPSLSSAVR